MYLSILLKLYCSRLTQPCSVSTRTLKILAASEEPLVTLEGGILKIESKSCQVLSNKSPEQAPSLSAGSRISSLVVLLTPFSLGSPPSAILLAATALTLVASGVHAQDDMDVCQSVIDIEISVPYDCPTTTLSMGNAYPPV